MNDKKYDFPDIFQNKLRLEIVSCLITGKKSFKEIKSITDASDGNISAQMKKLAEQDIVEIKKEFVNNKPKTTYILTKSGLKEFKDYVSMLEMIIKNNES